METIELSTVAPRLQSLLVMGLEGVGKTRFIGTCPKPILLYSFDGGYRTLAGMPGVRAKVFVDKDRQAPKACKEFSLEMKKFLRGEEPPYKWPDGREEPFKTVALDPISSWSMFKMFDILATNRRQDSKPEYAEWQTLLNAGNDLIGQCLDAVESRGAVLVCTAHLKPDKDEETGQLWFLPDMQGSIRESIGRYFDVVAILKTDKKPDGKVDYQFCTVGERRERARIRIPASLEGVIKAVDVPDYGVLQARLVEAANRQAAKEAEAIKRAQEAQQAGGK